jgi:dihydroorotate dehydrogenase electron transfer subunit
LSNEPICREHWKFILEADDFPPAEPGQFVQILCSDPEAPSANGPLLRRPFSIGGLKNKGDSSQLDILHRAIGRGTQWLSRLQEDDLLNVIGPLGQPFTVVEDKPVAYLVGGGVGLPPLIWLAERLREAGKEVIAFCGARSVDLLPLTMKGGRPIEPDQPTDAIREFSMLGATALIATDDGSMGAEGPITNAFQKYLNKHKKEARSAVIYTCGPEPMMKVAAQLAEDRSIPCQVCMERVMACGMGTCQSCVVAIRDESEEQGWSYKLCCSDGPVFDSRDIIWDK